MANTNLYEQLEVSPSASAAEIKDAYRRQAMKYHPDRNLGNRAEAEERFKQVCYAYRVLSDQSQRAEYDRELAEQAAGAGQRQKSETSRSDVTVADAENLFFEQMLELALELARLGYDQQKIIKMLRTLDCPEKLAARVAEMAHRLSTRSAEGGGETSSQRNKISKHDSSLETAGWDYVEPYYAAIIGGYRAEERLEDAAYTLELRASRKSLLGYLATFVSLIASITINAINPALAYVFAIPPIILVATIIWRISSGGSSKFRHEKTMRFYLNAFKRYYAGEPSSAKSINIWTIILSIYLSTPYWMVYRRMPLYAIITTITLYGIAIGVAVTMPPTHGGLNLYVYLLIASTATGLIATRLYFTHASRAITKAWSLERDQALFILKKRGGTNGWSWGILLIINIAIFLIAGGHNESPPLPPATVEQQTSGQPVQQSSDISNNQENGPTSSENISEEDRRVAATIAEIEARHPEFNPDDPRFNQALSEEALRRMQYHISNGLDKDAAIRAAVADMERGEPEPR